MSARVTLTQLVYDQNVWLGGGGGGAAVVDGVRRDMERCLK